VASPGGSTNVRTEGALLPAETLARIAAGDVSLGGLRPTDYHLDSGDRLNEAISRSWSRLRGRWATFVQARASLPAGDPGTTITRERWLLPLFQELGFGRLQTARAVELDGKSYPVSHAWGAVPLHLLGFRVQIGVRTPGVAGASQTIPHSLVQTLLNRSPEALWGIVTNGLKLRLLRDNVSLSRQAYVELDLETIFESEAYADFSLLWLLLHQSRFEAPKPEECWLEKWSHEARQQGKRLFEQLRDGVQHAIEDLGRGFLAHPGNAALREILRTGALERQDYYRELLRLVYRLLFLFVAEDRGLLHPKDDAGRFASERETYDRHYSTRRLRALAGKVRGTRHGDLWESLRPVFAALGLGAGQPALALPSLGGFLFSPQSAPHLDPAALANADLLRAVFSLGYTVEGAVRRPVDYRNLGAEELGSVYESLLELQPELDAAAATFSLGSIAGHERKTTGSYYTPESLVSALLDTALDPVLDTAAAALEPEKALLALSICDPACGSGHFLLAAAHRLARRLASVRTREQEPDPADVRVALRDVIGRCVYGVDRNPMAVELCKVSLWIETLDPGRPLSFLDHHIRCGNSLFGTTPDLVALGIPDGAYEALGGDDETQCAKLRRVNKADARALGSLFADHSREEAELLHRAAAAVSELSDDTPAGLAAKEHCFAEALKAPVYLKQTLLFDTWCAAFVLPKTAAGPRVQATPVPTTDTLRLVADRGEPPGQVQAAVKDAARNYGFFHWHIEFSEVFERGGFDAVVGNPPWERIKLQEKEFFAGKRPEIADAPNAAARRKLIASLADADVALSSEWAAALRKSASESLFIRLSGRYPLGGVGDVNTYAVFADLFRQLICPRGLAALLLPNGLVTGFTYRAFLRHLLETKTLASFYGFENEDRIFPEVHNETKFGILTIVGAARPIGAPWFTAHLRQPTQIQDPERRYSLSIEEIAAINPNTLSLPTFRWAADAQVAAAIHRDTPVLIRRYDNGRIDNPWRVELRAMFHMSSDSDQFLDHAKVEPHIVKRHGARAVLDDGREMYPLFEGKMLWHYDHRYGTYKGQTEKQANKGVLPHVGEGDHSDPDFQVQPRYWVAAEAVHSSLGQNAGRGWFFAWRDTGPSERTLVGTVIPRTAAGHKAPLIVPPTDPVDAAALVAILSSLVVDFDARQRSNLMTFFVVEQLATPHPGMLRHTLAWLGEPARDWLADRVVELCYTSVELESFARDAGCWGPPFRWNPGRRQLLQAEIDAAMFHLFDLSRDQCEWILDSFTVLQKYEKRDFGEYRTKRAILEIFDRMAEAKGGGKPYRTLLDPPPADPRCAHSVPVVALPVPTPVLPFRRVDPSQSDEFRTCVPLLSLKAAAGVFREGAEPEFEAWVEPASRHRLRKGMFVAQIAGRSMEPTVPDGSWCLFAGPVEGSRTNRTLLVEQLDPSGLPALTLKRFDSSGVTGKSRGRDHEERTGTIELLSLNPDVPGPRPVDEHDADTVRVIAELIEVLGSTGADRE